MQLVGLDENALRDTFRVEFIAPDGTVESGVDGGGLFKAQPAQLGGSWGSWGSWAKVIGGTKHSWNDLTFWETLQDMTLIWKIIWEDALGYDLVCSCLFALLQLAPCSLAGHKVPSPQNLPLPGST